MIDTSNAPDASPNGLEITFTVKELKRVLGGINTLVGNNEGSLVIGSNLPNTFGRGEKLQAEYTYGTKQSKGFSGTFVKPLHNRANTVYALLQIHYWPELIVIQLFLQVRIFDLSTKLWMAVFRLSSSRTGSYVGRQLRFSTVGKAILFFYNHLNLIINHLVL